MPWSPTVNMSVTENADAGAVGEALDRTMFLGERQILVIRKGRNTGHSYMLAPDGDTFIGRAKINDIVLDDRAISTRHLQIRTEGRVCTVIDLDSTNGSFLNDERLDREAFLQPGDVLRVGETELVYKVETG